MTPALLPQGVIRLSESKKHNRYYQYVKPRNTCLVLPYCLEGGKEFLAHWLRPGIGTIIIIKAYL